MLGGIQDSSYCSYTLLVLVLTQLAYVEIFAALKHRMCYPWADTNVLPCRLLPLTQSYLFQNPTFVKSSCWTTSQSSPLTSWLVPTPDPLWGSIQTLHLSLFFEINISILFFIYNAKYLSGISEAFLLQQIFRSWDNNIPPLHLYCGISLQTLEDCLPWLSPPSYPFLQATMKSCCTSLHYHLALLSFNPFPMLYMHLASLLNTLEGSW